MKTKLWLVAGAAVAMTLTYGCKPKGAQTAISGDAASKVYVAPGQHDEFYNIISGGFNGQMSVVGLPSGRVLKILPVFSVHPENGWGFRKKQNRC
jgi:nitrous-oxide reductase